MIRELGLAFLLLSIDHSSPAIEASEVAPGLAGADERIEFYRPRTGGPGTYVAWARLGQAYLDRARETGDDKDRKRGDRCLERSLGYQPSLEALKGLAASRLDRHRFREALELASGAVAAAPGDDTARALLFDAHLALGQLAQAGTVVAGDLVERPSSTVLSRQALLARRNGDLDLALDLMGRACGAVPAGPGGEDVRVWCEAQRGELHRLRCEPDLAQGAYARALATRPGHLLVREHLAELRAGQGRIDEAVALYRALLEERNDPLVRAALAESYAALGDDRHAAEQRAIAIRTMRRSVARGSVAELRPLALLLLEEQATVAEGLALAEQDWRNREDLLAADTLSWALFRDTRGGEALTILEPFLSAPGVEPAILLRAATILETQGLAQRAGELLDRLPGCPSGLGPGEHDLAAALGARLGGQ